MKTAFVLILFLFDFHLARAAVTPAQKPQVQKILVGSGSLSGGLAGSGFALLDLKSHINRQAKAERLMIDVGDMDGRPQKGLPGYFNVELQNNAKRVVVDFAQMPSTRIDTKKMKEKLKNSLFVKDVKMLEDPSDNTLSLILELHKPAKLKVYQVPGQKTTAKVVLDLLT